MDNITVSYPATIDDFDLSLARLKRTPCDWEHYYQYSDKAQDCMKVIARMDNPIAARMAHEILTTELTIQAGSPAYCYEIPAAYVLRGMGVPSPLDARYAFVWGERKR